VIPARNPACRAFPTFLFRFSLEIGGRGGAVFTIVY
jgi:hypothetical protein